MGVARRAALLDMFSVASLPATAGTAEDAEAAVARWSAAYTANDREAIVACYWPDAILLGTVSPVMSVGEEAIRQYFSAVVGSGRRNEIGEHRTIVLDDNAAVIMGFYVFTRPAPDGATRSSPSRFTMLVTRRDGAWRIAHHHSSPRGRPG